MRIVALDYDGTTSENPRCWILIAAILRNAGYKVICVCSRRETIANIEELGSVFPDWIQIIFTNHNPKKAFCEKRGIHINIWIDNDPSSIFQSDNPEKQICDVASEQ